ncbi:MULTISPECIES: hypothetical protein [unclassified Amycolatopsis]|uniref:hypothetical protein n=1 Tax=unclassified Amycolatopsis TaxID=2618356 RepID=UPI00106EFAF2|nr:MULTISPECIES: hypothetical protein [unclassified Amycolatopsis]
MADDRFFEMRDIDFYEYDDDARRLLEQGVDLNYLVAELRKMGCPKGGCVDVVSRIAGISLGEAKLLVHNSPAWADAKKPDERFQRKAAKAARKFDPKD